MCLELKDQSHCASYHPRENPRPGGCIARNCGQSELSTSVRGTMHGWRRLNKPYSIC